MTPRDEHEGGVMGYDLEAWYWIAALNATPNGKERG